MLQISSGLWTPVMFISVREDWVDEVWGCHAFVCRSSYYLLPVDEHLV
jgi:hypothetical protein